MAIQTIQNDLERLYIELEEVKRMSFKQACKVYNVDYKLEAIALIQDEIDRLESEMENTTFSYSDGELEEECQQICRVQGLSRYC